MLHPERSSPFWPQRLIGGCICVCVYMCVYVCVYVKGEGGYYVIKKRHNSKHCSQHFQNCNFHSTLSLYVFRNKCIVPPHRTTDTVQLWGDRTSGRKLRRRLIPQQKENKDNKIRWEEILESYSGRQVRRSRMVECCSPGQKSRRRPRKAWCVTSLFLSRSSSGKADQQPHPHFCHCVQLLSW